MYWACGFAAVPALVLKQVLQLRLFTPVNRPRREGHSLLSESLIGVFPGSMDPEQSTRLEASSSARLIFRGTRSRVFRSIFGPHGWDGKEKKKGML
jgi:hypothetical protein